MNRRFLALVVAAAALVAGCGEDDDALADLSPTAQEGRGITLSKGCSACHGSSGGGGVGPPFVGLYGSEVLLQSGDVVIADDEYLTESILDPRAKIVAGYNLPMPRTELSPEEIDSVLAYIEALAEVGS